MFRKNLMEREVEKSQIKSDNQLFLLYIVAAIFIAMLVINPISIIVGIIGYLRNKTKTTTIIVISIIVGFFLVILNSLISDKYALDIVRLYFMNYYEFKSGKGMGAFLFDYFVSGMFVFLFGIGMALGMYGVYWYTTYNNKEEAKSKSRKRYDSEGNETNFFKELDFEKLINVVVKKNHYKKEITHVEAEGTFIGISGFKNIVITDKEASGHGLVIGSTGRGKTTALLNVLDSCAERNIPLIFVDGKWDSDLPEQMKKLANKYNRPFYHFDMRGKLSKTCYNPLRIGDGDNIKEKLIDISDWSEEHYKANAERVIMLIVRVIEQLLKEFKGLTQDQINERLDIDRSQTNLEIKKDIICIQRLLEPAILERAIETIDDEEIRKECNSIYNRMNPTWYAGMESRLALVAESGLKELVKDTRDGIDLTKALEEGAIVLFSLDALRNRSVTQTMGRLIVKDVNTAVSMRIDKKRPAYAIYDEHGAYISEDIDGQFAMARSFGLRIITSTQNVADYKKSRLGDVLMRKVIGNTNFKLILMQNEPDDASYLAETIGTEKTTNRTISTDYNNDYKGSGMQDVESFIVHPNVIKNLGIGEAVLIKKIPTKQVIKNIKIRRVNFDEVLEHENEKRFDYEDKDHEIENIVKKKKGYDPLYRRNLRIERERKENRR